MEWYIIVILIIIIVSLSIVILRLKKRVDGELVIDTSDPEKDIYRLDLGENLEALGDKKTITLKIVRGIISLS